MGGIRPYPFQVGENAEHWALNRDNRIVQRMLDIDGDESDEMGDVGKLSPKLSSELLFWKLVCTLHLSLKEVDSWTLDEMRLAAAFGQMTSDNKRLWSTFYDVRREENNNRIQDSMAE